MTRRRGRPRINPRTPEQWQEAADLAQGFLEIDACKQFGLLTGGPVVNIERCHRILKMARRRGVRPGPDCGICLATAINAEAKAAGPKTGSVAG